MPSLSFARQRSALVLNFEVELDLKEEILILSLVFLFAKFIHLCCATIYDGEIKLYIKRY